MLTRSPLLILEYGSKVMRIWRNRTDLVFKLSLLSLLLTIIPPYVLAHSMAQDKQPKITKPTGEEEEYWTPERLRKAKPFPLPAPEIIPDESVDNSEDSPAGSDGKGPQEDLIPKQEDSHDSPVRKR
jgi:hypothetical protein